MFIKVAVFIQLLLFSFSTLSEVKISKATDIYAVHGMGQTTCQEVRQNFDKEGFQFSLRIWLDGYFTSINTVFVPHKFEVGLKSLEDSIGHIHSYCNDLANGEEWLANIINVYWRTLYLEKSDKN